MSGNVDKILSRETVLRWANSSDLETMGAVFKFLHKPEHYRRVRPALGFEDYRKFHLRYFERVLKENPDSVWCDSRYIAAHGLVGWFMGLWNDKSTPPEVLREIKMLVARLYMQGDEKLRICIITGVLEHLFADREILRYFAEWRQSVELDSAYLEALSYADNKITWKGQS